MKRPLVFQAVEIDGLGHITCRSLWLRMIKATDLHEREDAMKKTLIVIAAAAVALSSAPAFAKGCMKGAAVGAVGGHMVGKGHAVAGAAAGCAVGHHHAAKKAKAR